MSEPRRRLWIVRLTAGTAAPAKRGGRNRGRTGWWSFGPGNAARCGRGAVRFARIVPVPAMASRTPAFHPEETLLAKPNYEFQKRQKELEKKRKQEEKKQRKLERQAPPAEEGSAPAPTDPA
jgi:hypothetical protein